MAKVNEHLPGDCRPIAHILSRVGDKWTILLLNVLGDNTMRFKDLHRAVPGISQRMLTVTLRNLERDGLVGRTIYAQVPPRVEYTLTPVGKSLIPPALALAGWAIEHVPHIEASREAYQSR